jgi:hypothetical protein
MSVLNPPLNITEEDGSPKAWPYKAKFPNGSVTDNGDGTVSIAGGGGGGPETDPVFTAWNDPDVAYLTPGTAASTYEPLLPATPTNPETQFLNGNREWAPIRHNQLQAWNEDSDYQHIDAADRTNLDNLSGTNSGDQLTYKTIAVAGQSDVVATSETDTLTLAAGSNITLTTDAVNRKVTIASSGGASGGVTTLNGLSGDLSIAGTTNQISVAAAGSAITLSTPQDIDTAATPQFARLGLGEAAHATNQITGTGFDFSSLGQLTSSPIMKSAGYGLTLTPTFDNSSAAFQGLRVDVTNAASTGSSRVFYFGVGENTFQMTSVGGALMQNLTLDAASPLSGFSQTVTWNNAGYTYNAFLASITDTNSGVNSNIFRGVVGGVEKFAVRKDGRIVAPFYQFIGGTVSTFTAAVDNNKAALGGAFTFNNSAYTYHGVQVNLTNTASGLSSSLLYLYTDSALRMRQFADGRLYVETGTITRNLGTTPLIRFSTTISQSGYTYHSFDVNSTHTASAVGSTLFRVLDGTDAKLTVNKFGSVICNSAALDTNATDGFLYIPTTTDTPSGTPRSYTGRVAMHYDTANNKLWIYNGGWKSVTLA